MTRKIVRVPPVPVQDSFTWSGLDENDLQILRIALGEYARKHATLPSGARAGALTEELEAFGVG